MVHTTSGTPKYKVVQIQERLGNLVFRGVKNQSIVKHSDCRSPKGPK